VLLRGVVLSCLSSCCIAFLPAESLPTIMRSVKEESETRKGEEEKLEKNTYTGRKERGGSAQRESGKKKTKFEVVDCPQGERLR
jgi:hypothetical protein